MANKKLKQLKTQIEYNVFNKNGFFNYLHFK